MKTLVSLSFILAVFLGRPTLVVQKPVSPQEHQHPLLGDQVPVQGHVEEEVPASPITAGSKEKDKLLDKEQSPLHIKGEPDVQMEPKASGRSCYPGVTLEGKHYQFFKGPKRAEDAEFFCQKQFPGGHLASITSQHIHREVMSMMLQQNGAYTRTWIGGLRYLETGRFIWLDGSHWRYADWLLGEPNNTSGVEYCVELLAFGNGKFNDFTCWEPQAFICSYPV